METILAATASNKTTPQNHAISWSFSRSNSNGKEKDWESGFHYYGARYYWSELLTGWLSVDPMADKYPSITPYAYCAWNPVKLVDPDGREIYYKEGKTHFVYRRDAEGKYGFYNCSTGEVYSGKHKEYVGDLTKALGKLKEGAYGNKLVSYFEGHQDRPLYIYEGTENNQTGANINWNNTDKPRLPVGTTLSDPVQIESSETFVSLGHEMAHARDAYKFGNKFNSMSRKVKEQRAMLAENFIRREHGFRQRTFYGLKDGGGAVDYDSYPALVLPQFPIKMNLGDKILNSILFDF